jgi:transglutaminase-like putative cysteine protease
MMLDAATLAAPLLEHCPAGLAGAASISYRLEQSFRYEYDAPVHALRQRLIVVPPARHGNQHLRAHHLDVSGAVVRRRVRRDAFGNTVAWLRADRVAGAIEFRFAALIERVRGDRLPVGPAAALTSPALLQPTRLTAADDRLREMAARVMRQQQDPRSRAASICDLVSAAMTYEDGITSVQTTAARALAGGRGVCQDYAHIMLALCHLTGLPARYVSGHLLGQGGTHAWVEVIVPRLRHAVALAFDPCNGRRTDDGYLTVATGRDYADVAPASGSYVGGSANRLTAGRRVGVLAVT